MNFNLLPDNSPFPFWEDTTSYLRVLHVAQQHPAADDANPGTEAAPLKTISAAAERLCPAEKSVIHEGVYRETVSPSRGGSGADQMIAYEAAPGEKVVISAAEELTPEVRPSAGWRLQALPGNITVWMTDLPAALFVGYNPFLARNTYDYLFQYGQTQDREWMQRVLLRRGAVMFRGKPLRQVLFARDLAHCDGAFWVEEPGAFQNLDGWQTFFELDQNSRQATLDVAFDADTLALKLSADAAAPIPVKSPLLAGELTHPEPGPFSAPQWAALRQGKTIAFDWNQGKEEKNE